MPTFPLLFSRGRIGTMSLKNRYVMPPMVRNYADANGFVTDRYVAHIERIARGGVGMMILEASFITSEGKGFAHQLGIHHDLTIPGLRRLSNAARKHGAKIGIQLFHAGRQTSSKTTKHELVAPSAIPDPTIMEVPHELTHDEINHLVKAYAAAALRAKKAGLDFVEMHGAHGYLITQFLSPFSNRRRDGYGGTLDRRMRFLEEVYAAVREAVGSRYPVTVRLSGDELVAGGLRLDDTKRIARRLEELGADALHISAGNYASYARGLMIPPMAVPDAPLIRLSDGVKKAVGIPVIAVAKIRTPKEAEQFLKSGKADFIAIGRTLLADPDFPNKVREDRLNDVNGCIACNQGCIGRLFAQEDVWCTVNPETGREKLFAKKHGKKKRVLVVGGGPAGLSAAKAAAERGHDVVLFEKHGKLGGQLNAAASLPYRSDWADFIRTLERTVRRLGVTVRLRTEFDPATICRGDFDAAVVAIGSTPVRPNIPGAERTNVVIARDLVEGWAEAKGRVVVAGGGCMGAQVAEVLAKNGHPVTIVEASGALAVDAPSDDRNLLLERLKKLKVKTLTDHKVMSIGSSLVTVEGPGRANSIPADTVVLCLGAHVNDGIQTELKKMIPTVIVAGDAKQVGRATDAVAEGALAALAI